MHELKGQGYKVMRTAGSHGEFDVIAVKPSKVMFIQCKTTKMNDIADRLLRGFKANPPLMISPLYEQVMMVYVMGSREILRVEV